MNKLNNNFISSTFFFFCRYNDPMLKQVINDTKTLQADLLEISLLETLILCRKGMIYIRVSNEYFC